MLLLPFLRFNGRDEAALVKLILAALERNLLPDFARIEKLILVFKTCFGKKNSQFNRFWTRT